jgi:hypothetical protein
LQGHVEQSLEIELRAAVCGARRSRRTFAREEDDELEEAAVVAGCKEITGRFSQQILGAKVKQKWRGDCGQLAWANTDMCGRSPNPEDPYYSKRGLPTCIDETQVSLQTAIAAVSASVNVNASADTPG